MKTTFTPGWWTLHNGDALYILGETMTMERHETQASIAEWANATFGPAGSNARVAARANEEMAELLRAVTADDNHPKAIEEVADVFIVLYRLAWRMGVDIHAEIDRKMKINRQREWKLDNTGHGYHIRQSHRRDEMTPEIAALAIITVSCVGMVVFAVLTVRENRKRRQFEADDAKKRAGETK